MPYIVTCAQHDRLVLAPPDATCDTHHWTRDASKARIFHNEYLALAMATIMTRNMNGPVADVEPAP